MVKCLAWYICICISVINIGFYCLWASPKGFSLERFLTLSKKKKRFLWHRPTVMHFYIGYQFHLVLIIEFWLFTLPFFWLTVQGEVLTTIGFLKEAPQISFHGFNVYHKNRLILVSSWLLKKCNDSWCLKKKKMQFKGIWDWTLDFTLYPLFMREGGTDWLLLLLACSLFHSLVGRLFNFLSVHPPPHKIPNLILFSNSNDVLKPLPFSFPLQPFWQVVSYLDSRGRGVVGKKLIEPSLY